MKTSQGIEKAGTVHERLALKRLRIIALKDPKMIQLRAEAVEAHKEYVATVNTVTYEVWEEKAKEAVAYYNSLMECSAKKLNIPIKMAPGEIEFYKVKPFS